MENVRTENNQRLLDLFQLVNDKCRDVQFINNLMISGVFLISEINSDFIRGFKDKAALWQAFERPTQLEFNHGEYIHKYKNKHQKNGLEFFVSELKKKSDSNRAFWSLLDMSDIVNSGDNPIPSFLLLQVGFKQAPNNRELIVTAYYRALEVSEFLPINMAEICSVIEYINNSFSHEIISFDLNILAFKAYVKQNFSCLQKAKIDLLQPEQIGMEVTLRNFDYIKELLKNKINTYESKIRTEGISFLSNSLVLYNQKGEADRTIHKYNDKLVNSIKNSLELIMQHNEIRDVTSYSQKSGEIITQYKAQLSIAIDVLSNL